METSVFEFSFLKRLLLRNCAVNFVEIFNFCVGKMVIKAAKRIFNSDKICRNYNDLNVGVTFLEHSVCVTACYLTTLKTAVYNTITATYIHMENSKDHNRSYHLCTCVCARVCVCVRERAFGQAALYTLYRFYHRLSGSPKLLYKP